MRRAVRGRTSEVGGDDFGDDLVGLRPLRPLLDVPKARLIATLRAAGWDWVQDPSNADTRFARSRLRVSLWPVLEQAFPQAESSLALAARHAQSAAALAREVAQDDLARVADAAGLHLPLWAALGPARQRNALRGWLQQALGQFPPYTLVDRLMAELPASRELVNWNDVEARRCSMVTWCERPK